VASDHADLAAFQAFDQYAQQLEALCGSPASESVTEHLDGRPATELRERVDLDARRAYGAFFTSAIYRASVFGGDWPLPRASTYFDAACGAGDLLLAAAATLPLGGNPVETTRGWGRRLAGVDVIPAFVRAARARLYLLACVRTGSFQACHPQELETLLAGIRVGDGLEAFAEMENTYTGCLLLNPPYRAAVAPAAYTLGAGRISQAAVFVDSGVKALAAGGTLVALLPDVLRSGTNYERWRRSIAGRASMLDVSPLHQFDQWTDVDVFALRMTRGEPMVTSLARWVPQVVGRTLGEQATVCVGPVVPFRDKEEGPRRPYLHAKVVPLDGELVRYEENRRYQGRVFSPPFVVVRRTSRPEARTRLSATVIRGVEPVAVENHLLVVEPNDGSLKSCLALASHLRSPEAAQWMDSRIRCRHITTAALKALPWEPQ
jgi:hypothetical protein